LGFLPPKISQIFWDEKNIKFSGKNTLKQNFQIFFSPFISFFQEEEEGKKSIHQNKV